MSNIIINNNENFICHYPEDQLPKCDYEGRDMNFLMSQITGFMIMGELDKANNVYNFFNAQLIELAKQGEHGVRISEGWRHRLTVYLNNNQELSSKYILKWLEEKLNR
jgi:hypothetical protein